MTCPPPSIKYTLDGMEYSVEFLPDFKKPVPSAFRAPLEKRTLSRGDIFYDNRIAYRVGTPWGVALQSGIRAMQVIRSTSFEVTFAVLEPNPDYSVLVKREERTLTYLELYRFLGEVSPFRFSSAWERSQRVHVTDE